MAVNTSETKTLYRATIVEVPKTGQLGEEREMDASSPDVGERNSSQFRTLCYLTPGEAARAMIRWADEAKKTYVAVRIYEHPTAPGEEKEVRQEHDGGIILLQAMQFFGLELRNRELTAVLDKEDIRFIREELAKQEEGKNS